MEQDDIKMYRGTSEKILEHPIENGALYFSTSDAEIYMDYNNKRLILLSPQQNKKYWGNFEDIDNNPS